MDCSPTGSSVHGIFQTRILECVSISYSRVSYWPRDWPSVSYIGRQVLYHCATWEAQPLCIPNRNIASFKSYCFKCKLKMSNGHLNDRYEETKILFLRRTVTGLLFFWTCHFSAVICDMTGYYINCEARLNSSEPLQVIQKMKLCSWICFLGYINGHSPTMENKCLSYKIRNVLIWSLHIYY